MIMNNRRTKELPKILIGQFAVTLLIVVMALSILYYAEGFRFNWKNLKVIKTGIIHLVSFPKGGDVYINGKSTSKKTPFSKNLTAGYYNIKITKSGYISWTSAVKIEPELVVDYKNIILIRENIDARELEDPKKIDLLDSPEDELAAKNSLLYYNDYELWQGNNLITRFSTPIFKAVLYPDQNHVVYQRGDEIRIIEINGTNDILLVKLHDKIATKFIISSKGDEIYFIDQNKNKAATIR